jgi:hypothetical protein
MLKETIVKLIPILIIFCFSSCKEIKNDDIHLAELILNDYDNTDLITIRNQSNNKDVISFFNNRNTKEETFKHANKDGSKLKIDDSLFYKFDTIIKSTRQVKNNNYLIRGKGIDLKVERFLKDSFNYKLDSIFWKIDMSKFSLSTKKMEKQITISKPVYNLDKNKAIVFRTINSKNWVDKKIFFLRKKDEGWKVIYTESNH